LGQFVTQMSSAGPENGQNLIPDENILRTENRSCTLFPLSILSSAGGGGRIFRALRIPAIRSARNECSTTSRRRIVHGQIESP
jgi:hypothetical protein